MPKATVSIQTERFDLKSAPPDGFIELRRMTYGDWLARRDMAMAMSMVGDGKSNSVDASMKMQNQKVTEFEFKKCVVDHNLEDEAGSKLDFSNPTIMDILDPRVGNEIGVLINDMHDFEGDLKN